MGCVMRAKRDLTDGFKAPKRIFTKCADYNDALHTAKSFTHSNPFAPLESMDRQLHLCNGDGTETVVDIPARKKIPENRMATTKERQDARKRAAAEESDILEEGMRRARQESDGKGDSGPPPPSGISERAGRAPRGKVCALSGISGRSRTGVKFAPTKCGGGCSEERCGDGVRAPEELEEASRMPENTRQIRRTPITTRRLDRTQQRMCSLGDR